MTRGAPQIFRTAFELRQEFDLTFAKPHQVETVESENLLAIRAGSTPYGVRLAEITKLFADKPITALPNASPELLGISGFRGIIFPVYSLRVLLGHPVGASPRWMVLVESMQAFAFDDVEGCLRVSRDAILPATSAETASQHANQVVWTHNAIRPIVNLSSVLKSLGEQTGADAQKE